MDMLTKLLSWIGFELLWYSQAALPCNAGYENKCITLTVVGDYEGELKIYVQSGRGKKLQ